ncbi:MAG: DUF3137 domain-containing protein [Alphaproteobacteria bacterium]|nr:DUF3137 domain-containing protein [Alphaproteobacteria bacterium]
MSKESRSTAKTTLNREKDMSDKILPDDEKKEKFDLFFQKRIEPLVITQNKQKEKYLGRFWCFFWTMIFLVAVNTLIVLFNVILHHHPLNVTQLFLVMAAGVAIVVFPLYSYHKLPKTDIFSVFLSFFGAWKYKQNAPQLSSELLPARKKFNMINNVSQQYLGVKISIGDLIHHAHTCAWHFMRTEPKIIGTFISLTFSQVVEDKIMLFEKRGKYSRTKYPPLRVIGPYINIPAANFFNIFAVRQNAYEDVLCSRFFEALLDLKETFKAKKIYVQIERNRMDIVMSDSRFYFNHYRIWSKKIHKNRFDAAYNQVEQVYEMAEDILAILQRRNNRKL